MVTNAHAAEDRKKRRPTVTRTQDPGVLVVELDRAEVIQMPQEGEETAALFVVPNFDSIIVTAGHEERLGAVEIHPCVWLGGGRRRKKKHKKSEKQRSPTGR